jgi:putative phage-type endonuclease
MPSATRYYIGGGNIAAILGISPFSTKLDAYHGIIGESPELDRDTERFFARRKALEPYVAHMLGERDIAVEAANERYTDPHYPFLRSEIDAENTGADGERENNELKTVHPLAAHLWALEGYDQGGAPDYVTAQLQWGLGITGRKRGRIVAAIGFDSTRHYPELRDDDVIGWMRSTAIQFWEGNVLKRIAPPPSSVADILTWVKEDPNKVIEATDIADLAKTVDDYLLARESTKEAERYTEQLKTKIQMAMVDATVLTVEGKTVLTWKRNRDSQEVDHTTMAADASRRLREAGLEPPNPADYTAPKKGNRVFLPKRSKA